MRSITVTAAAAALLFMAAPAGAATFVFSMNGDANNATNTELNQGVWTLDGLQLTAKGYTYAGNVSSLPTATVGAVVTLPTLTEAQIYIQGSSGVGVASPSENSGQDAEIETNGLNEILELSFSAAPGYDALTSGYSLTSATFQLMQNQDTLALFGKTFGGQIKYLGYSGNLGSNFGGLTVTGPNSQPTITFNTAEYSAFYFASAAETTNRGFSVYSASLSGAAPTETAIPEPATWAMMVLGFGFGGAMLRRRRMQPVAA